MLSSGGMTKRLDRLADAGLVERTPDPNDRRGTLVRLTGRGKAMIDTLLPIHLTNEQRLLASLSPAPSTSCCGHSWPTSSNPRERTDDDERPPHRTGALAGQERLARRLARAILNR